MVDLSWIKNIKGHIGKTGLPIQEEKEHYVLEYERDIKEIFNTLLEEMTEIIFLSKELENKEITLTEDMKIKLRNDLYLNLLTNTNPGLRILPFEYIEVLYKFLLGKRVNYILSGTKFNSELIRKLEDKMSNKIIYDIASDSYKSLELTLNDKSEMTLYTNIYKGDKRELNWNIVNNGNIEQIVYFNLSQENKLKDLTANVNRIKVDLKKKFIDYIEDRTNGPILLKAITGLYGIEYINMALSEHAYLLRVLLGRDED